MADILYTYKNQIYANITNKCDCRCTFCIRFQEDGIGDSETLWHKTDPTQQEILDAINNYGDEKLKSYDEFVFCGYGEPTCSLEILLTTARYIKEKYGLKIRVNTNGLGNLYHKKNIIPELKEVVDSISISLNAPNEEEYNAVTRPQFSNAFQAMQDFAKECMETGIHTQMSVVDVLSKEDIEKCQKIADQAGVYLKVRHFA